ncbi:transporter [bacterium]|nr:transporter [bacterium]
MKKTIAVLLAVIFITAPAVAQESTPLMQSFLYDAVMPEKPMVEAGLLWVNYSEWDVKELIIATRCGFSINDKIAIFGQLAHVNISTEFADATNGLSDVGIFGRYLISDNGTTSFTAGPFLTIPIGKEEVGQSNLNYGGVAAMRHSFGNGMTITANAGLEFLEMVTGGEFKNGEWVTETGHESSFMLGAGLLYPLKDDITLIAEWTMRQEVEYMVLSGAIQYRLGPGNLRAGFGIGLDDGAPDIMIAGGYLLTIGN